MAGAALRPRTSRPVTADAIMRLVWFMVILLRVVGV
jgi:hypothetical protein